MGKASRRQETVSVVCFLLLRRAFGIRINLDATMNVGSAIAFWLMAS
jgi:hypothetical protein